MAPNSEVIGPAHGARHGRGQGHPRERRRAQGLGRPVDREGAGRGHQAGRIPTSCSPPPSRPTATRARIPAQVAELLGLPTVTFAKHIEVADGKVKVDRQTEAGYDEVECPLPAVVTVTAGVVEPRYPSFKGIMAAKNKPVDELKVADLGLTADQVGMDRRPPGDHRGRTGRGAPGGRDRRGRRRRPREDRRLPRAAEGDLGSIARRG